MRRFVTALVILVLIAIVVDRAACWFAERTIAARVQSAENLAARPEVNVHGFPFLTQVLRGRYQQVDARLTTPTVQEGLKIDTLDVRLRGIRVPMSSLVSRQVDGVPVDSATAVAGVSFASLNEAARQNLPNDKSKLEFAPGEGNRLAVTGTYRSSRLTAKISAPVELVAEDGDLVIRVPPDALDGLTRFLRPQVQALVEKAGRMPDLPFGFQARSVKVGPAALTIQAEAAALELHR